MRIYHTFHKNRNEPHIGEAMEPKTNTVGVQMILEGSGTVTASVQPKGRIATDSKTLPLENIGTVISFSGTAPVSKSITLNDVVASEIYFDLTAIGSTLMSFSAFGREADR